MSNQDKLNILFRDHGKILMVRYRTICHFIKLPVHFYVDRKNALFHGIFLLRGQRIKRYCCKVAKTIKIVLKKFDYMWCRNLTYKRVLTAT